MGFKYYATKKEIKIHSKQLYSFLKNIGKKTYIDNSHPALVVQGGCFYIAGRVELQLPKYDRSLYRVLMHKHYSLFPFSMFFYFAKP